jgi:uncharacterized Zn finger protein
MSTKRKKVITRLDRVAQYVDSDLLRQRIKVGKKLACVIDGNYGVYRTRATISGKRFKGAECTCPSDYRPCKHADALALTYRQAPKTFVDVDEVLRPLGKRTPKELLGVIREMIVAAPESLRALGIEGFEEREEEEERW